jgi:valyl-tRNA synthetase
MFGNKEHINFSSYNHSITNVDLMWVLIKEIRSIRTLLDINRSQLIDINLGYLPMHKLHAAIENLTKVKCTEDLQRESMDVCIGDLNVKLFIFDHIDTDKMISRTNKKIEDVNSNMKILNNRLDNPYFIQKAPASVISKSQVELKKLMTDKENHQKLLCILEGGVK